MKTYLFYDKNSSIVITLSANTFEQAYFLLVQTVKHPADFRAEDEEGEEDVQN